MTLAELMAISENKNLEVVLIDKNNYMRSIRSAELKVTMIGSMIAIKVDE